jgi:hypothetical protein
MMLDTVEDVRPLNGKDRCDRCGAQAYYTAIKGEQDFLFCQHHATKLGPGLTAAGWAIHRDVLADALMEQPGTSA